MLNLLCTSDDCLRLHVSRGIEQVMDAANRHFIATHKQFDTLVKAACDSSSLDAMQCGTGILENLFKDSQETCLRLVRCGALEGVLLGCRNSDTTVLQHCAAALANCSMYGGPKCQMQMVAKHAAHWLFPLAFSQDNVVQYYALLAICFLASNAKLEGEVAKSGTLDLVLPFIQTQDPEEFPKTCYNHAHGRSSGWLSKLVPLLVCGNEQARSLSAFHFAMETAIKKKQHRLQVWIASAVLPVGVAYCSTLLPVGGLIAVPYYRWVGLLQYFIASGCGLLQYLTASGWAYSSTLLPVGVAYCSTLWPVGGLSAPYSGL